jgi:hypothetical protein
MMYVHTVAQHPYTRPAHVELKGDMCHSSQNTNGIKKKEAYMLPTQDKLYMSVPTECGTYAMMAKPSIMLLPHSWNSQLNEEKKTTIMMDMLPSLAVAFTWNCQHHKHLHETQILFCTAPSLKISLVASANFWSHMPPKTCLPPLDIRAALRVQTCSVYVKPAG